MDLATFIRDVPDFPKKGIIFKDITTLLKEPLAFKSAIDIMAERYSRIVVTKVVGIESRGFVFGGALAYKLNCGFVPCRKAGKLPAATIREEYTLEYGSNALEMHVDGIQKGDQVLVVDDLLATGGTALATAKLVTKLAGNVIGFEFLIELEFLSGRNKLQGYRVNSLIRY